MSQRSAPCCWTHPSNNPVSHGSHQSDASHRFRSSATPAPIDHPQPLSLNCEWTPSFPSSLAATHLPLAAAEAPERGLPAQGVRGICQRVNAVAARSRAYNRPTWSSRHGIELKRPQSSSTYAPLHILTINDPRALPPPSHGCDRVVPLCATSPPTRPLGRTLLFQLPHRPAHRHNVHRFAKRYTLGRANRTCPEEAAGGRKCPPRKEDIHPRRRR